MSYSTKYKLLIASGIVWTGTFLICVLAWVKSNLIDSEIYIYLPLFCMFIVVFPTLYIASTNKRVVEYDKLNPSSDTDGISLEPFLKDAPRIFKVVLFIVFINLVLSIVANLDKNNTSVSRRFDQYIFTDDNNVERIISKMEYQNFFIEDVKRFSSFTLLFISFSFIILERLVYWEKKDNWDRQSSQE